MRIILCGCNLYAIGNKTLKGVVISVCLADAFNVTRFLRFYMLLNYFLFVCSSLSGLMKEVLKRHGSR